MFSLQTAKVCISGTVLLLVLNIHWNLFVASLITTSCSCYVIGRLRAVSLR